MKKSLYLLTYFYITKLLPSLGTSSFFFETDYIWLQKLTFSILGIIFFYTDLKHSIKRITKKNIIFSSVIPSLLIYLFYMFLILIINKEISFNTDKQLSILLLINYVILTPFVEELVYRYGLLIFPSKKIFRVALLLISMVIFTYGHAASVSYNGIYLIPFLFMAATLSYIYIKEKNIWYSIICHSFYNFTVITLNYFPAIF